MQLHISSICKHEGEEPPISGEKGICNVFFSHCNLQCIYCQNHQISQNSLSSPILSLEEATSTICAFLETGIRSLGFVSPSHQIPQMLRIISAVRERGYNPVIVYNTNSYDKVETLRDMAPWVDIYLADMKYADEKMGRQLSGVKGYPHIAMKALQEMVRQKGTTLQLDEQGIAVSGVIIRHLVLPGYVENSIGVLNEMATQVNTKITVSLMAQYYPAFKARKRPPLNRRLYTFEYQKVVDHLDQLGFENGWIQALESSDNYQPDFEKGDPFNNSGE